MSPQSERVLLFIQLHPRDNVVVSLGGDAVGTAWEQVLAAEAIPAGHKMAVQEIASGQPVVKYGYPIGVAQESIPAGHHIHSHNLRTRLNDSGTEEFQRTVAAGAATRTDGSAFTFSGWERPDGRVAIRNEIWILNTVACVNQTATKLAAWANQHLVGSVPHLHGVHAFNHPYGCSQLGDDLEYTRSILTCLARHPHAAGVLILGLGCENNQLSDQLAEIGQQYSGKIRSFSTQQVPDELEYGQNQLRELAQQVASHPPIQLESSRLVLGMKCGGSDGLSGITGNPLLGRLADRHCAAGGTTLLTEVPEMFGAESILLQRTTDDKVFQAARAMVDDFKDYFRSHGQPVSENPSPGNKDGGITTLEEKSLGCVQKGGTAPVKSVVPYGQMAPPCLGGLALINGPGNDGVSITALTAAGANIVLFTTGRGTPMGAPAPTVKISTNEALAKHKPSWIDFDAGIIAQGTSNLDNTCDQLTIWLQQLCNREVEARNETNGYREIAIWKNGVTL